MKSSGLADKKGKNQAQDDDIYDFEVGTKPEKKKSKAAKNDESLFGFEKSQADYRREKRQKEREKEMASRVGKQRWQAEMARRCGKQRCQADVASRDGRHTSA